MYTEHSVSADGDAPEENKMGEGGRERRWGRQAEAWGSPTMQTGWSVNAPRAGSCLPKGARVRGAGGGTGEGEGP